jgi:hypothetical protein
MSQKFHPMVEEILIKTVDAIAIVSLPISVSVYFLFKSHETLLHWVEYSEVRSFKKTSRKKRVR